MNSSTYVGRLAPSPTGALHLGNVRTFMIAWLRARSQGGKVIFRMEDLDHPKDKPGAAAAAVDDLRWLGFDWDEEYVQSERRAIYRKALADLRSQPQPSPSTFSRVYPCACSRKAVESAQSAPHAGEQLHYPGTCRGRFASWQAAQDVLVPVPRAVLGRGVTQPSVRSPCWRFAVEPNTVVTFDDAFAGSYTQNVAATLGDFPLARDEDGAGYTFACTVDDLLMGVTEVVRGDDLLAATPAQILIAEALGRTPPSYCHVPLVVGPDGRRLAKRHGDTRIALYREQGKSPEEILGFLAASCGWAALGEKASLRDLIPRFDLKTIPREPFVITLKCDLTTLVQ